MGKSGWESEKEIGIKKVWLFHFIMRYGLYLVKIIVCLSYIFCDGYEATEFKNEQRHFLHKQTLTYMIVNFTSKF